MFGSILPIILTGFSWAFINTSVLLIVNMYDVVLIYRTILVNISDVVKTFCDKVFADINCQCYCVLMKLIFK